MAPGSPHDSARAKSTRAKLADAWRNRAMSLKAISFGLIGVLNTAVDYGVFLVARAAYEHLAAALAYSRGLRKPAAAAGRRPCS